MDAADFYRLAARLVEEKEPASCRTAVSRAYYALFHVARDLLDENKFRIDRSDSAHEQVFRHLHNSGDPEVAEIGQYLNDLRSRRNKADYRIDDPKWEHPATSRLFVLRVEGQMKAIKVAFSAAERKGAIVRAIDTWRQAIGMTRSG
jgi:uncharacterized protein (UPF0332 family)